MNKYVFHKYGLLLLRRGVFAMTFLVLSSCGGGTGEFYMSPCFPLPESWCTPAQPAPPDTTPPTTPTNLVAHAVSPSRIDLSWGESKDFDSAGQDHYVSGYKIYRDGIFFTNAYGATNSSTVTYSEGRLTPTTQYCFTVSAYDSAGNESGKSNTACAITPADTAPPTVPAKLSAMPFSSDGIYVQWDASTDDGYVAGYQIYRDGALIGTTLYTSITDTGLTGETQYCYTVQAVDGAAKKSASSNEACATTSWQRSAVDPYVDLLWTSIAVDLNNKAHIAYYDDTYDVAVGGSAGLVKYATNLSGTWQSHQIGNVAPIVSGSISLQVNADGTRHVAYYDFSKFHLQHAMWSSGVWTTGLIATNAMNISTVAMAHDGVGKLHMVANPNGIVTYLTNTSGNWTSFVVGNNNVVYGNVRTCAIAADGAGKAYVGYYDYLSHSLQFVFNASGTWVTETVDNTADVGMHTTIAVDAGGNTHIGYYDNTSGDLKYATNTSGFWSAQTIDSVGDVGPSAAIALDGNGYAHISYTDATRHVLKYATNKSGSWATYIIDSSQAVTDIYGNGGGGYTSIAIDSLGKAHISYRGNSALYYATNR